MSTEETASGAQVPCSDLLVEAVTIITELHSQLYECLATYAMTEPAQAHIMRLLREATLFKRKANASLLLRNGAQRNGGSIE